MSASPRRALRHLSGGPGEEEVSDPELARRLSAGDTAALDVLIARHGARVNGYLKHMIADPGWCDDLTQEVFVRVYERAHQFDARWPFTVWLFRIARNLALDLIRREGVQQRVRETLRDRGLETVPSALHAAEHEEFRDAFADAIVDMAEEFRSVFLLRENEHMSYEDIGSVIGMTAKTVSSRLHRARLHLRTALARFLDDEDER